MGYYTWFEMKIEKLGEKEKVPDILQWLADYNDVNDASFYPFRNTIEDKLDECKENPDYPYGVDELGVLQPDESYKWYEYDNEMIALSRAFPDTIFKLHGDGEESGDNWDKYYKNGKSVLYRAEIPPLDPKDLE